MMMSRRSRGMHHLFINLHVEYKYNNYLHTHTHTHTQLALTLGAAGIAFHQTQAIFTAKKRPKKGKLRAKMSLAAQLCVPKTRKSLLAHAFCSSYHSEILASPWFLYIFVL